MISSASIANNRFPTAFFLMLKIELPAELRDQIAQAVQALSGTPDKVSIQSRLRGSTAGYWVLSKAGA